MDSNKNQCEQESVTNFDTKCSYKLDCAFKVGNVCKYATWNLNGWTDGEEPSCNND